MLSRLRSNVIRGQATIGLDILEAKIERSRLGTCAKRKDGRSNVGRGREDQREFDVSWSMSADAE